QTWDIEINVTQTSHQILNKTFLSIGRNDTEILPHLPDTFYINLGNMFRSTSESTNEDFARAVLGARMYTEDCSLVLYCSEIIIVCQSLIYKRTPRYCGPGGLGLK